MEDKEKNSKSQDTEEKEVKKQESTQEVKEEKKKTSEEKKDTKEKKEKKKEEKKVDYRALIKKMSDEELQIVFETAAQSATFLETLQRTKADYNNYQKRMEREKNNIYKYANQDLLRSLLGVNDTFDRAIQSAEQAKVDKSFLEGMCMAQKDLMKVLEDYHVKEIEALEKKFDPTYHEALQRMESDKYPDMTVMQVYEKGFMFHDRVLRASKVVVSCKPKKKEEPKKETCEEKKDTSEEKEEK